MTPSESKSRFFLLNESIRIDSHNESNRFESRIGMLYYATGSDWLEHGQLRSMSVRMSIIGCDARQSPCAGRTDYLSVKFCCQFHLDTEMLHAGAREGEVEERGST